jgi:predicted AAA+ superfamily ATPase
MPNQFIERFFRLPPHSFFLFGPRGTGKSTLLQQLYPDALWINFLNPAEERAYSGRPERLYSLLATGEQKIVIIDEVQKVPAVLTIVHDHIVSSRNRCQFILTGSNARKLKREGADLLAGRALRRFLYPFMAAELGQQFDFLHALQYGMLPVLLNSLDPAAALEAYVGLYLKEEIQMEGLVRSLDNFSRFLEVISFSHTATLNITNIARECGVKRKTVENYITILEDLLLAYKLPVFTRKARRELIQHPKFYLFDTGVFRILRPTGPLDRVTEIEGAALEGLVAQHLHAWVNYSAGQHKLYYWRTRSGVEIDFIIYGPLGLYAIEVKNTTQIHSRDLKPLLSFREDYPAAELILLYRGNETLQEDGVLIMPCEAFLQRLIPNQPVI